MNLGSLDFESIMLVLWPFIKLPFIVWINFNVIILLNGMRVALVIMCIQIQKLHLVPISL